MDRPKHAGLRHLALNVQRLDEMKVFYVDLLGFAVEWEPDADNIYLSSGIDNLALHRSGGHAGPPLHNVGTSSGHADSPLHDVRADQRVGPGALDHLGLIVRAADDVDRWAEYLEGNGVTIVAKPKTHRDGARSCYFLDPDGNRVQIIHHPPISDTV